MFDSMRMCAYLRMYMEIGASERGWKKENIDVQNQFQNENNARNVEQNQRTYKHNVHIQAHVRAYIFMCAIVDTVLL